VLVLPRHILYSSELFVAPGNKTTQKAGTPTKAGATKPGATKPGATKPGATKPGRKATEPGK
jgi:hypothetical protein